MANNNKKLVVFVHGWSVRNTSTYGEFPDRLEAEAKLNAGLDIDVRHIWLGKYVSFRDEVQLQDISRAFESALQNQLKEEISQGRRFVCITHSTGGPVVRDWLDRYYFQENIILCPLSHLIMLAPANFGSALAQLGKGRIGRIRAWTKGVEPGQGVLDWLALGSPEAWKLNKRWFEYPNLSSLNKPIFQFVLTGQQINRAVYDHANSYTGELGSDGVVRVASANLNARYIRLVQQEPGVSFASTTPQYKAPDLHIDNQKKSQRTAFALIGGRSHSGMKMGIIQSIKNDGKPHPTVDAVLKCLTVQSNNDYGQLCDQFEESNINIMAAEQLERDRHLIRPDGYYIHDPFSMVIFRITDDQSYPVEDFDLIMTGKKNSPNKLPQDFMKDKQRNKRHSGTITFFLNHALMTYCPPITDPKRQGEIVRMKEKMRRALVLGCTPTLPRG